MTLGRRFVVGFMTGTLVVLLGGLMFIHNYMLDGLDGWFASTVLGFGKSEDTEYALGYSDQAFRRVRTGMTPREVIATLGPPLDKANLSGGRETWRWSRSRRDRSYRVRAMLFFDGKVTEIRHEFYVD